MNKGDVAVAITGGWQTWQTVSGTIDLEESRGILRLKILDPEFNINWFQLTSLGGPLSDPVRQLNLYPNPVKDSFELHLPDVKGLVKVQIVSLDGKIVKEQQIENGASVEVHQLRRGIYLVNAWAKNDHFKGKIIIE